MPLIQSGSKSAIGTNIREMQNSGHPHAQAVAAALHTADMSNRHHRAFGGGLPGSMPPRSLASPIHRPAPINAPKQIQMPRMHLAGGGFSLSDSVPFYERNEAREVAEPYHPAGLFSGSGAGRTDRIPTAVAADSFVLPADILSGIGEGNTLAGAKIMDAILSSGGPYGTPQPKAPSIRYAAGGQVQPPGVSHVLVASGEYLVHRNQLMNVGYRRRAKGKRDVRPDPKADLSEGHKWAREFVDKVRGHVKKFLNSAPKPKR